MCTVVTESLESRVFPTVVLGGPITLSFSKLTTAVQAGKVAPPIIVWAQDINGHIARRFNATVAFSIGDGPYSTRPLATSRFHAGIAVLKGVLITQASSYGIFASAAGATAADSATLVVNPGPVASISVNASVVLPIYNTSNFDETVALDTRDAYGNHSRITKAILRLGHVSKPGVQVELLGLDNQGRKNPAVIFKKGRPVGQRIGDDSVVDIIFIGVAEAVAKGTSVQLVFSDRKISPILTPLANPN